MTRPPQELVRPAIRALAAYSAPQPNELIKLSTMENPYHWPSELVDAWLGELREVHVNRYPDAQARELKGALRNYLDLPGETPLLLGNGSDELIQLILMTLASSNCTVLAPSPTFVMYRHSALATGVDYVPVELNPGDFRLSHNAMIDAVEKHRPEVIFISHPNNPTGNLFDRTVIDDVLAASDGLVVLDEAYAPFANDTYLPQLDRFPNLLVMRTLSKVGLAGLRLGMLLGSAEWIAEFEKLRLPYNINSLTQLSARFALQHREVFDEQTRLICEGREVLLRGLSALANVHVFPTAANFIMFRTAAGQAVRVFEELQRHGVLIKNLHGSDPLLDDCLRVSVGTPAENSAFLRAMTEIV